jgi:hypothetical protein
MIQTRVYEMVSRGVFRRAPGQPGVILGEAQAGAKPRSAKGRKTRRGGRKRMTARRRRRNTAGDAKPSLRTILTNLLAESQQPLKARELAARAEAQGYQTKSKDLTNVVWVMLGRMENVENLPGEGYRLKKR